MGIKGITAEQSRERKKTILQMYSEQKIHPDIIALGLNISVSYTKLIIRESVATEDAWHITPRIKNKAVTTEKEQESHTHVFLNAGYFKTQKTIKNHPKIIFSNGCLPEIGCCKYPTEHENVNRWCNVPIERGDVYCNKHYNLCYVKTRYKGRKHDDYV